MDIRNKIGVEYWTRKKRVLLSDSFLIHGIYNVTVFLNKEDRESLRF